jgi:hypothetical protein
MSEAGDRRDRRRVLSAGTALIERGPGRSAAEFEIRDLSSTGARLVGSSRLVDGEVVRVTLRLDNDVVSVIAQVIRTDPQRAQTAIAFRDVPRAAADRIAAAVTAMASRQRASSAETVLVVQPDGEVRAALERDLLRISRVARNCATPLELTWALSEPVRYTAAIINGDLPAGDIRAIVQHLAADHPAIARVLLFGDRLPSLDHATSSLASSVLRTPWQIRALARAIGADLNDSSLALLIGKRPLPS